MTDYGALLVSGSSLQEVSRSLTRAIQALPPEGLAQKWAGTLDRGELGRGSSFPAGRGVSGGVRKRTSLRPTFFKT